jgi:nucleotide-binding universal stress UspA family protein
MPVTAETRILLPLDGSRLAEQVIPYARAIAGTEGTITFLHVVPEPEPLRGLFGAQVATADEVLAMERETANALMLETAQRWAAVLGKEPAIHIVVGDPAEAILETARTTGATALAMASHGRGMASRIAFGSVADRIARSSPLPVLIVHPAENGDREPAPATVRRVVTPLDGSESAAEALPVARQIAKQCGLSLHLVTAVNPSAMLLPSPVGAAYYPAELYQEVSDDMTSAAREALTEAEQALAENSVEVTTAVVEGSAVPAIESELREGDILVMTSHGRGGFSRWLLGSVSEKLIRQGVAPVVLVPSKERVAASQGGM